MRSRDACSRNFSEPVRSGRGPARLHGGGQADDYGVNVRRAGKQARQAGACGRIAIAHGQQLPGQHGHRDGQRCRRRHQPACAQALDIQRALVTHSYLCAAFHSPLPPANAMRA